MTCFDLDNARAIFGTYLAGIRGKIVRQKPNRVDTSEIMVPRHFYATHRIVTLTANVMFVNGVPFLVTLSRKIRLFTVEYLLSRTAVQLRNYLAKVIKLYAREGFSVQTILMDQEFDKVIDQLPEVEINTSAAREHIGKIEQGISVIKERCRATLTIMPSEQIPKSFVIHLVYFYVVAEQFPCDTGYF